MSKTLQNIIEKAHKAGFANKNARMWLGYGYGELESQWQARYNKDTDVFELDHSTDQFVTKVQFVGKKELTDFII